MRDVSEPARDLVRRLLTCDPQQRATIAQALNHPWIRVRCRDAIQQQTCNAAPGRIDIDQTSAVTWCKRLVILLTAAMPCVSRRGTVSAGAADCSAGPAAGPGQLPVGRAPGPHRGRDALLQRAPQAEGRRAGGRELLAVGAHTDRLRLRRPGGVGRGGGRHSRSVFTGASVRSYDNVRPLARVETA